MFQRKSSVKKTLVTNACLAVIIAGVYLMAFWPFGGLVRGPAMQGNTGEDNIGLQIAVDEQSDVAAYLAMLDGLGAKATFFFSESRQDDVDAARLVMQSGHSIGTYDKNGMESGMYIGSGYSVPVMSYAQPGRFAQVGTSIDLGRLTQREDWEDVLAGSLSRDMFLLIPADNDLDQFKKTVQIVRDKGYTILKVDEML